MKRDAFQLLKDNSTVRLLKISKEKNERDLEIATNLKFNSIIRKPLLFENLDSEWSKVVRYYNHVLIDESFKFKLPHLRRFSLWIQGEPGVGKTLFLDQLMTLFNCYVIQKDEVQNKNYSGGYDIIVIDEYGGEKGITWMNELITSKKMDIRIPGGKTTLKNEKVPVIVVSNYTIRQCYPNETEIVINALEDRFYHVHLTTFGNPFKIDTHWEYQTELDNLIEGISPTIEFSNVNLLNENNKE